MTKKELARAVSAFAEKIAVEQREILRGSKDPEANTSAIIQDFLSSLGYGIGRGGGMEREFRVAAIGSEDKCDYALWSDGRRQLKPDILVEVKAVTKSLDSKKYENQIYGYAVRCGVSWAVLTNGLRWRGFRMQRRGGGVMPTTLFDVDVSDGTTDEVMAVFNALSREGMRDKMAALERRAALFKPDFVGELLLGDRPVKHLVGLMKERGVEVTPDEMRTMLRERVVGCAVAVPDRPTPKAERRKANPEAANGEFFLKGRGMTARGRRADEGFLVFAGTPVCDPVPSFFASCRSAVRLREALEADGTIADGAFTKDYVFSSSSAAASVVMGRASNGPKEWKNADGISLGDIVSG